jgi:AraC-like DNA-binding protein
MPPATKAPDGLEIWRVRDLRDLELRRADGLAAAQRPQVHGEFEIAVVERGAQRLRHRGASHVVAAGSLIVIPPGEVHSHQPLSDQTASCSFFPDLAALRDASDTEQSPSFREIAIDDREVSARISALHRLLARPGSMLSRQTNAVLAATMLVTRHARQRVPEHRGRVEAGPIERARDFLHDHLDANVSLAELTGVAGLPAIALVTAFTRAIGMPPHAYHVQLRVNHAKRLLSQGVPPARVAFATGFVDQSHFARHFKRCVGVTPGHYVAAAI